MSRRMQRFGYESVAMTNLEDSLGVLVGTNVDFWLPSVGGHHHPHIQGSVVNFHQIGLGGRMFFNTLIGHPLIPSHQCFVEQVDSFSHSCSNYFVIETCEIDERKKKLFKKHEHIINFMAKRVNLQI